MINGANRILGRVESLPALPQAAVEAMQALRDEDCPAERCAELIGNDPALAARTLRIANSAFYGMPGRVGSVRDAVLLLGRRPIGTLVTALVVGRQFPATACEGFDFAAFWRHAAASAIAARAVARAARLDEEIAFTCALLQDIGVLALASHVPHLLQPALRAAQSEDVPLHEVEPRLLGTDHAAVGAVIARRWHLGEEVAGAVADHHHPASAANGTPSMAAVVHVADAIARGLDLTQCDDECVPEADLAAWSALEVSPALMLRIFAETEQQTHALCEALAA